MNYRELAYKLVSKLAVEHNLEETEPDSYEYWETIREAKEFAKVSIDFFVENFDVAEKEHWVKIKSHIGNLHSA